VTTLVESITVSGLDVLARAIESYRFNIGTELELQDGIERVLSRQYETVPVRRDVKIGKDRIDFVVGSIGIEVKIGGTLSALTRQIHRYIQDETLHGLLVVTTKSGHRQMPEAINGKPVRVLYLMGSLL
jgi:hypothetical protein